ncbi:MAG: ABC transporter permease [Streptococcus salivarius]
MALWTREGNHEIGILLAIGKSKGRIFVQFLVEILLVSLMSLLPAIAIGRLLSRLFLQNFRTARTTGSSVIRSNSSGTTFRAILSLSSSLGNIIARCDNRSHLAQNTKRNLINMS